MNVPAEKDADKEDLFLLICTYVSGGSSALWNLDPRSSRESFDMCSLMKKMKIKSDDSLDPDSITIRQVVSRYPLLVASALHKSSGKISGIFGTIKGLHEALMFPWAINMIPTSSSWESLRVLWKMWKESYPNRVVEKSMRAEYMRLNYDFDGVYNREKLMTKFDINPPSSEYVVTKIDTLLERYGYGDNYTAFEIIFATSARDIWNFYERHSGAYCYTDFSRCPEMITGLTDAVPLDLTVPGRDLVSLESKTSTSQDKVCSVPEQRKTSGKITTVCFDEFKELKTLVDSIARKSEQTEVKMTNSRESDSDLEHGLKSKATTGHGILNGVYAGKSNSQKFHEKDVEITVHQNEPQYLTVRPREVSEKSTKKYNSTEPSTNGSWEYRLLREAVMPRNGEKTRGTEIDQKEVGKRKRSAFQEDGDSVSRASVMRDIVRRYFIENLPPQNFSCDSPACFVFPELPVLKWYGHQNAGFDPADLNQYNKTSEIDVLLCSLPRRSEQREMSDSVVEKQEVPERDVFVKPKTPPLRKMLPRRESLKKEAALSVRKNHVSNFNSLKDSETKKQGALRKHGCPSPPAVKTNGLLKSSRTSEFGNFQNSSVSTNKETIDVMENGCAESDLSRSKNFVKNPDRRQETKDRDGPCFYHATVCPAGDLPGTSSASLVFKADCSGDTVDLETQKTAKELISKWPERSKSNPLSEKENVEVPFGVKVTSVQKEVKSKSSGVTEVTRPPRSHNISTSRQDGASKSLEIRYSAFGTIAEGKSPCKKQTRLPDVEYSRVSHSTKRMSNSDDAKLAPVLMTSQSNLFTTSASWEPRDDYYLLLAAIREFLPPPPPVVRSNRRKLTKQMLNVMRARGAWQNDRQTNGD